jgi:hypothetical protein
VCVAVENTPRDDGAIGGLALCDSCSKQMVTMQGAAYAKITPITS